jgi:hypothetical protein
MAALLRIFATGIALAMLLTGAALAGDDVDYSAPYLVVEDGELVTKYPNREHEAAAASAAAAAAPTATDVVAAEETGGAPWLVAAVVVAGAVAALFVAMRFRSRA